MPTFPNHRAAISGTIEDNETPNEAALRELQEETNLCELLPQLTLQDGLFLDVPYTSSTTRVDGGAVQQRTIRVYPFRVHVTTNLQKHLQRKGTEHDAMDWVTPSQLARRTCVPKLLSAFHHATRGKYSLVPLVIRDWAANTQDGASVMTQLALTILRDRLQQQPQPQQSHDDDATIPLLAQHMAMMRPTMVSIVNVLRMVQQTPLLLVQQQQPSFYQSSVEASVSVRVQAVRALLSKQNSTTTTNCTIATFSRSGMVTRILQQLLLLLSRPDGTTIRIWCSHSMPGNEGMLLAQDLGGGATDTVMCLADDQLLQQLEHVDLVLIGADCLVRNDNARVVDTNNDNNENHSPVSNYSTIVNKVGTRKLCETAAKLQVPVYCCADPWKVWNDTFLPPLEPDLFEAFPANLVTKILMAHPQ